MVQTDVDRQQPWREQNEQLTNPGHVRQGTCTRPQVDERTVKLLVGVIAFMLPALVAWFAWPRALLSISDAYWAGGWAQTTFTGLLFAIAALLCSYDGQSGYERLASRLAAVAALMIALFPCSCDGHAESVKGLHYSAAFVLYMLLGYFCWEFRARALRKGWRHARRRARVYVGCLAMLALAIGMLALNLVLEGALADRFRPYVFLWEAVGLLAFALSWLTASHWLPVVNAPGERFHPLRKEYVSPLNVEQAGAGRTEPAICDVP
jgi:hypothetical protein